MLDVLLGNKEGSTWFSQAWQQTQTEQAHRTSATPPTSHLESLPASRSSRTEEFSFCTAPLRIFYCFVSKGKFFCASVLGQTWPTQPHKQLKMLPTKVLLLSVTLLSIAIAMARAQPPCFGNMGSSKRGYDVGYGKAKPFTSGMDKTRFPLSRDTRRTRQTRRTNKHTDTRTRLSQLSRKSLPLIPSLQFTGATGISLGRGFACAMTLIK